MGVLVLQDYCTLYLCGRVLFLMTLLNILSQSFYFFIFLLWAFFLYTFILKALFQHCSVCLCVTWQLLQAGRKGGHQAACWRRALPGGNYSIIQWGLTSRHLLHSSAFLTELKFKEGKSEKYILKVVTLCSNLRRHVTSSFLSCFIHGFLSWFLTPGCVYMNLSFFATDYSFKY